MRIRKAYLVPLALLLVLALAATLAGCGGQAEQQQQPPAQEQAQPQQPAPEQQQTQTAPSESSTEAAAEQQTAPDSTGQQAGGASVASGKDYVMANCLSCHQVEGQGSGSDLSKVGSKYDAAALKDFLKTKHPMPFPGSDADLEAVAQYLAGLK